MKPARVKNVRPVAVVVGAINRFAIPGLSGLPERLANNIIEVEAA